MTPEHAVMVLITWIALASFTAGLLVDRAVLWVGDWIKRRRMLRLAKSATPGPIMVSRHRQCGKTTEWLHAYQDEVALMARSDAGKTANAMAAMLQARVAMRMAGGIHHG